MSKRFIFPQQNSERKRAKLDISISDHNFPLSQNSANNKEADQTDNWGDDNDDEILLLASQACEEAYTSDISQIQDYTLCMRPGSTSTQYDPGPSTSKSTFTFKKPNAVPPSVVSTNLRDKCTRISSPLPGISSKMTPKDHVILNDLTFNDKVYKGDAEYVYKQLLQLQEENAKLKSENGKLLEKCVTKEGEASILRTQLKSCQQSVDNARLERIKAQERVQMEYTEKLTAANGQLHDLRTQLDFKNLEIISIKEKCRMLESNKIKLTQVTVPNTDISSSNRNHSVTNETMSPLSKRVRTSTNCVQTDDKLNFVKLYKTFRAEQSHLSSVLHHLLQPTAEHISLLEYNEKLQKHTDLSQHKCRIYNTFHRVPSTPVASGIEVKCTVDLHQVYEDLMVIAKGEDSDKERFCKVLSSTKRVLRNVLIDLQAIYHKMTTAFQKEMDEKYIETTNTYDVIREHDLISGKTLFKEEQSIQARRLLAVLSYLLAHENMDERTFKKCDEGNSDDSKFVDLLGRICDLLDTTSCAIYYSGLLLSITSCLINIQKYTNKKAILEIIKHIISSRPLLPVAYSVLELLSKDCDVLNELCPKSSGNLRVDYDQGVLLYKKDSCYIQVLLKQMEAALKCIEKQSLLREAIASAQALISFHAVFNDGCCFQQDKDKCDCQLVLMQVLVYALRICATFLKEYNRIEKESETCELLCICRNGTQVLYQCLLRDCEFTTQLGYNEGHLIEFCDIVKAYETKEVYCNMLAEISGTFQSSPEEMTSSFSKQPWVFSFDLFTLTD